MTVFMGWGCMAVQWWYRFSFGPPCSGGIVMTACTVVCLSFSTGRNCLLMVPTHSWKGGAMQLLASHHNCWTSRALSFSSWEDIQIRIAGSVMYKV